MKSTPAKKCIGCGSNIKPSCSFCTFFAGDINQKWVVEECRKSQEIYLNSYCYKKNTYLKGCLHSFDPSLYDEGTPY